MKKPKCPVCGGVEFKDYKLPDWVNRWSLDRDFYIYAPNGRRLFSLEPDEDIYLCTDCEILFIGG